MLCRGSHCAFTLPMEQPLQSSRGQHQRHCNPLTHNRCAHINIGNAGEHVRYKVAVIKRGGVAVLCSLVIRCAVNVVENRRGQTGFGKYPEVFDIMAIR